MSILGKTTSSFGMLLVRLEIIASTYRSTIFETYVFSLYSHRCINASMYLYSYQIYTPYIWTGDRRCLRAIRGAPEDDDRVHSEMQLEAEFEGSQRCTWRLQSSQFGDALEGRYRLNSVMHLVAIIERVWRCTWRPRASELRDAIGGRDQACLEMHLYGVI